MKFQGRKRKNVNFSDLQRRFVHVFLKIADGGYQITVI